MCALNYYQNPIYIPLIHMRCTGSTHFILLDVIILIAFDEQ